MKVVMVAAVLAGIAAIVLAMLSYDRGIYWAVYVNVGSLLLSVLVVRMNVKLMRRFPRGHAHPEY